MVLGCSTGWGPAAYCGDFLNVRNALDIWGCSEELTGDLSAHWSLQSLLFLAAFVPGVVLVGGIMLLQEDVHSPLTLFFSFQNVCKHFLFTM